VFGRPIGQNQGVAFPIARAHADMIAAELVVKKAAGCSRRSGTAAPRPTWARCWRPMQLEGGRGLPADLRRLRLRARVRHRAQVARDATLPDAPSPPTWCSLTSPSTCWACAVV